MATSLLVLLDDIATILDDVAVMSKAAAKKTAGVLADDLALNAEQVSGVKANRELPVVWAVAKGSFVNKAILVPAALLISALAPWAIVPLLMIGGAYLCLEGFEKVSHRLLHSQAEDDAHHAEELKAVANPKVNMVQFERRKIKGAIRTDFILSAEIIVITLGVVASAGFIKQVVVLSFMAIAITVFVYGMVAGILMLDDAGLYLYRQQGESRWHSLQRRMGAWILRSAPWLMKGLSFAGTTAMFLVGGGILVHGIPPAHHLVQHWTENMGSVSGVLAEMALNGIAGIIAGALVLGVVLFSQRTIQAIKA